VKRQKESGANSRVAKVCTQIKLLQIGYGLGSHWWIRRHTTQWKEERGLRDPNPYRQDRTCVGLKTMKREYW